MRHTYALHPKCNMQLTSERLFDVRYTQVWFNLYNLKPNIEVLDIPISPPLEETFQIFQIRMSSESYHCEWSMHRKPYAQCKVVDFLFKAETDKRDSMLQETWLVTSPARCEPPYLFLSYKELAGVDPGRSRFEIRVTG